jgi:hypothetical protein
MEKSERREKLPDAARCTALDGNAAIGTIRGKNARQTAKWQASRNSSRPDFDKPADLP